MTKFGYTLSTSIAAMILSVTAAQNALAQNTNGNHNQNNNAVGNQSPGAVDPGVRGGPPGAGGPIAGLTAAQQAFFLPLPRQALG
jgi:hypothetical protein